MRSEIADEIEHLLTVKTDTAWDEVCARAQVLSNLAVLDLNDNHIEADGALALVESTTLTPRLVIV
jgi:hypothetical protein